MDDLQGKQLTVKQTVHFKVREDLVVDSGLIVKTGADAFGHIEAVSKSGLFGKSGKLFVQFDYVESIAGMKIPLRGGAGFSGGKGRGAHLGIGHVVWTERKSAGRNDDQRVC